jgi:hypothetical protein
MDYPFSVREIGAIPDRCLQQLVSELPPENRFRQHPAFGGQTVLTNQERGFSPNLIQEVLSHLPQFPAAQYNGYELNYMGPNTQIAEHSDLGSKHPGVAYAIAHRHKVHLVLTSNPQVITYHRRSKHSPETSLHMQPGKLYLYNDYIWHRVVNDGDTPRVHMLISFWDRDWTIKETLIADALGGRRYEE